MHKNWLIALLIGGGLILWMASGIIFGEPPETDHVTLSERNSERKAKGQVRIAQVRAEVRHAQPRKRFLTLRGRTQSKRMVDVKAEVAGKVVARPIERGARVLQGDLLCQLALDDRQVALIQMQAALKEAEIEHAGSQKLKARGLQSQTAIARSEATLESARAGVRRAELNLERTRIVAPFDGVVESLPLNVGDYATNGSLCATVIDLDPMLIAAEVTEVEVGYVQLGTAVSGSTSVGAEIQGRLTFVGKQSDPLTRTYSVEATVENADYAVPSGLTTSVRIELNEVLAHKVSPALFGLDDAGAMGLRLIDKDNRVVFYAVEVIEDTAQGAWVTGLPNKVDLITVGQEFVLAGQLVEPIYVDAQDNPNIKADSVSRASRVLEAEALNVDLAEPTTVLSTAPVGNIR